MSAWVQNQLIPDCALGNDRTNIGAQTYTYNGLGDRVRVDKPTGTRHFVYDAWGRVVAEYGASANDVKAEFIWALPPAANDNSTYGGGDHIAGYAPLALVAENSSSQLELYWVHGNHLGVPVVTTNALGQVVSPSNDFLRPGFPGQSEVLSDLYYNRARDYDPVTGRYIQADPIGLMGDVNPYVYAGADPINMIDPDGELAWWVVPVGFALWELGSQAYDLWSRGCDPLNYRHYNYWNVGFAFASGLGGGGLANGGARYGLSFASRGTKRRIGEAFGRAAVHARNLRGPFGKTGNKAPRAGEVTSLPKITGRGRRARSDFYYKDRSGSTRILEAKYSSNPPKNPRNLLTPAQKHLYDQVGPGVMNIHVVTPGNVANAAGIVGAGAAGIASQVGD